MGDRPDWPPDEKLKLPTTREEWQDAVDAAHGLLALDSARIYGLVKGGPIVNVGRCQRLLKAGAMVNVIPSIDSIDRCVSDLMSRPEHV